MNAATTPDAGHRDTASTTATPQKSGLPGWLRLVVSALAFVLALIALILIRNATSEVGTQNTRNFHFVDIAAKGLETWPQSIQTMVRNQYLLNKTDNQSVALYHPQIGSYIVHFFSPIPNEKKCRSADGRKLDNYQLAVSFDESIHPGQGVRVVVSGGVYLHPEVNIPGRPDAPLQCFMVRVPLDRLITTATAGTATPVSHILIVDEAGAVLAQSGEPVLPLNRIDQLDPTDTLSKNMIAQVLPGKSSADKSDKPATRTVDDGDRGPDRANAAITPAMTRDVMALHSRGEDYLAYVKPFQISGSLQQPYSSGQDNQAARSAAATASASATYYIVGLIPRADLTRDWITSMPVLRTATLLGLLALLMLLPTLHFLLIGGTESISRADVIGIILGVPTALGLALMLLLFLFDLGANRTEAKRELAATSTSLATNTGAELQKRLANLAAIVTSNAPVPVPSTDPFMLGVAVNDTGESPDMTPRAVTTQPEAKKRIQQQEIYDKPDGIKDRFVVAVDASGRDYFQILRDKGGDHLEISPASVVYTLGLEHSQTNGFDLGVIAMRPDNKETCGDPAGPKPVRNCRIAAFPIASLIAPLLPDPTHFLVIDTTNWAGNTAHLPIIAQDERGVASRENLLDDADLADEVINQLTDLGRRTDTRCANHPLAGQVDRTPFQFSGRYAGRNTLFAAQRIAGNMWPRPRTSCAYCY